MPGVMDDFTDTNGKLLTTHIPGMNTPGGSWTAFGTAPAAVGEIQNNRLRITDGGDGLIRGFVIDCGSSVPSVGVRFVGNSINPAWGGLALRSSADGASCWKFRYNHDLQRVELINPSGGTAFTSMTGLAGDEFLFTVFFTTASAFTCAARNIRTGEQVIYQASSSESPANTHFGVCARTAFGSGADDWFDDFKAVTSRRHRRQIFPGPYRSSDWGRTE